MPAFSASALPALDTDAYGMCPPTAASSPLHVAHAAPQVPRALYPAIEARAHGWLEPVPGEAGGHRVYWEESGAADGAPVLFLHGGPGGGTTPSHRCFFDPKGAEAGTFFSKEQLRAPAAGRS